MGKSWFFRRYLRNPRAAVHSGFAFSWSDGEVESNTHISLWVLFSNLKTLIHNFISSKFL